MTHDKLFKLRAGEQGVRSVDPSALPEALALALQAADGKGGGGGAGGGGESVGAPADGRRPAPRSSPGTWRSAG